MEFVFFSPKLRNGLTTFQIDGTYFWKGFNHELIQMICVQAKLFVLLTCRAQWLWPEFRNQVFWNTAFFSHTWWFVLLPVRLIGKDFAIPVTLKKTSVLLSDRTLLETDKIKERPEG